LDWSESGGPTVTLPSAKGFGTRIILASIEQQLRGQANFEWRPEGLHCVFSIPLSNMEDAEYLESQANIETAADDPIIAMSGSSVMLVEDEAIVALAVNDSLTAL